MSFVEFAAPTGLILTAQMFEPESDTSVDTASSVVEQANVKGSYVAEVSSSLRGAHLIVAYDTGAAVAARWAYLTDDAFAVHRSGNYADVVAAEHLELVRKVEQNKQVTDPVAGKMIVYEDDGVTPFLQADLFEDVAETQRYRGRGAEVRGKLE